MLKKTVALLLVLYTLLGVFLLPWVAKTQIIQIVEQETNAKISIENISFNPFLFKLQLTNVQLQSLQNKPLVNFKSLFLDLELYSLFNSTIHLKNILLKEPELFISLSKEKKLNLLGILKEQKVERKKEVDEPFKLPRILIDKIQLLAGNVEYEDYTKSEKYTFNFHNLGFSLQNIDTQNFNSKGSQLNFYTNLDDSGYLEVKTKILTLTPLKLDGEIKLHANKLYSQWKYIKEMLNLEVADGKVFLTSHFKLNLADLNATLIDKLNISVNKLRIIPKNGYRDILTLHNLVLTNASVKPFVQDVIIEKISFDSLHLDVKRSKRGLIDLLEYIKPNTLTQEEIKSEKISKKSKPWNILLSQLDLKNISANFEDKGIYPKVNTKLNSLNIHAENITLAGIKPLHYTLDMLLNDEFKCNADGFITHNVLDMNLHLKCQNFDLVHYAPYLDKIASSALEVYDVRVRRAKIGLSTNISLKEINQEFILNARDTNLSISRLLVSKRSSKKTLLAFNALKVSNLSLDFAKKKLGIDKVALYNPNIHTVLSDKGVINFENIIVPKRKKSAKIKVKKEKAFDIHLKHFAIYNAQIDFKDETLSPALTNRLDKINLHLYNVNAKRNTWLSYKLSSRVNKKGKIFLKGRLRHTPLKEKGSLKLSNILLTKLTPYIQRKAFIRVADGKLFLNAKTAYGLSKKSPDLKVEGHISLQDFFLNDSRDDASIFSINDVNVSSFTFELNPNRLYIDQVSLKSFYIDALIDEKKQMNYAKLIKVSERNETQEVNATTELNATKFPIKIAKINIIDGNAKFIDLSIPLKFKTDIHSLNGAIYSVSNDANETSYVDIDGEVDKYGSTKLKGSINNANPKEFTDLNFNFKNLDLHSLSGYSATFAGYEIDEGKLFLDLGYKIKNSELLGSNSIIIKNIKLGKESKDENVTKLPLGFVIGLLEDSDGVIDIDMPVEGNLNEPDFKYGALVWKTFGQLIVRAVTSPFRFLGSLMGLDSDDLEYAEFEKGSSYITPTEKEKLDNIVKMMIKRPKIELKITPIYDVKLDTKALQKKKLINLVMKKSGITNEKEHQTAMNINLLKDIYKEFKDDDALNILEDKVKKSAKENSYERDYLNKLIELCTQIQVVSLQELESLAKQRASEIKRYLVKEKSVEESKITIQKISKVDFSKDNLIKIGLNIEVK